MAGIRHKLKINKQQLRASRQKVICLTKSEFWLLQTRLLQKGAVRLQRNVKFPLTHAVLIKLNNKKLRYRCNFTHF